jgi:RsiW-degrading membrane proteinase PrsW (M82 family)
MCYLAIVAAVLFIACSPNIITKIPSKGDKYLVALVHGIIFTALFMLLSRYTSISLLEGARGRNKSRKSGKSMPTWAIVLICLLAIPLGLATLYMGATLLLPILY